MKSKPRTIGEIYGPATEITTQEEADEYFEQLVSEFVTERAMTRHKADELIKSNLGYYAGYYSNETRERVERLFRCAHPVFGNIASNGPPTPEQAFAAGKKLGKAAR